MRLADGSLTYYHRVSKMISHDYQFGWTGKKPLRATIDIDRFANFDVVIPAGGMVKISHNTSTLKATIIAADGSLVSETSSGSDEAKTKALHRNILFFSGCHFAKPCYREDLKSMSRYFNPPLHYQSIE